MLGFNPEAVLRFAFRSPRRATTRAARRSCWSGWSPHLAAHGGVVSAAYGSCAPVSGGLQPHDHDAFRIARRSRAEQRITDQCPLGYSPRYFDTLGIRLVRGRVFTDRDRIGQPKVVVINETAARTYWGGEDPIGKRLAIGQGGLRR